MKKRRKQPRPMAPYHSKTLPSLDAVYGRVRALLKTARQHAWTSVNHFMVQAYWNVGRIIVEEEQKGRARAGYGERLLEHLSTRLRGEFGGGFDPSNLRYMRLFYSAYPIRGAVRRESQGFVICDALRHELSWTHYRLLLRVGKAEARAFYEAEAISTRWSTRELERQIASLLYERLALSRDKTGVKALAQKGHKISRPSDMVKDPYVLEFAGIPQERRLLESDLEEALISNLQAFLLELGKFPQKGSRLVSAGLKSPVIRNRNMAIRVLSKWGEANWGTNFRQALQEAAGAEPNADVKKRIREVLSGREIS